MGTKKYKQRDNCIRWICVFILLLGLNNRLKIYEGAMKTKSEVCE